MSDHKLVKFSRCAKSFKQNSGFVRKRCYKNFDPQQFRDQLGGSQLEDVLLCTDPNEPAELLTNKINTLLDKMAPVRTIQTHSKYAPWLGDDTKKLKEERERHRTVNPEDFFMFWYFLLFPRNYSHWYERVFSIDK